MGVVVKIENMIIQSRLRWYGHVMRGDINSQILEVKEVEITGKKEEGSTKEIVGRVRKERFGMIWLEKRGCVRSKKNDKSELEQKLLTPACRDNDIKKDVVIVAVFVFP